MKKVSEPKPTPKKSDQPPEFALFRKGVTGKEILDRLGIIPKQ